MSDILNRDLLEMLVLLKTKNSLHKHDDEAHLQVTARQMLKFFDNYHSDFQQRFGTDPMNIAAQYGILDRHSAVVLAHIGEFGSASPIVERQLKDVPDAYFLLGIWYHKPDAQGADIHRLNYRDIDNVIDLVISHMTKDDAKATQVLDHNIKVRK